MQRFWAVVGIICILLAFPMPVASKYDPLTTPNNKFGIHVVDINDIADAATLVNGGGGDWGYVTIVIQEDDRNHEKWQRMFNQMRRLHVIPIVRLATHIEGDSWAKPYKDSAADWARFLNDLNWPTENRYVVLFNEPNHANEWGRTVNPEEYGDVVVQYAHALHATSEDFFVMQAGLDVSAATDRASLDAATYLSRELSHTQGLFDELDGLSSHSYPNPGFSGSPYATGRGTLRSYVWELSFLRAQGITKPLPIFITETGWVHNQGVSFQPGLLTSETIGMNLSVAATSVWTDPAIVAVTPFVLNYQGLPFDHFSWRQFQSPDFYPQYFTYRDIPKAAGQPFQRESYTLAEPLIPQSLVAGSTYTLQATVENGGQGILSDAYGYGVKLIADVNLPVVFDPLPTLEPGERGIISIHLETPEKAANHSFRLVLTHWGREITLQSGTFRLVPPPSLKLSVQLGWKKSSNASDVTVLVYDKLTLIHKFNGLTLKNGQVLVEGLRNVVPGQTYRIVVLTSYYLPRQAEVKLGSEETTVAIPRAYPLDFDRDGALTWKDAVAMVRLKPNFILSLFVGP